MAEFDEALFRATVNTYTVHSEQAMAVRFRDGTEITVDVCDKG